MGLDSYLFREKVYDTEFKLPHRLYGGMFSGCGEDGSFRGEVYADIFYEATGMSLYVKRMSPEEVKQAAEKLDQWWQQMKNSPELEGILKSSEFEVTPEEIEALVELFKQAAEKECQYAGWW